ncbi:MAG: alanine racemase, partial [Rhodobacteraceae bacterium]|nr:alanine racemase [Paracoccaceae bacterium]
GAVVKADAYGLGAARVAPALARAGARSFFVAEAAEGRALRQVLGQGPAIFVFSGHMAGDAPSLFEAGLVPLLNSPEQVARQAAALPDAPFGLQLDSGMNRLGLEPDDWAALRDALPGTPALVISHLACADAPDAAMNDSQLQSFRAMTDGITVPRSLAATGGILLGGAYHFEMVRPGIGLYGGLPFAAARQVVRLDLPVIQTRAVLPGEAVGYGRAFVADRPMQVATVSGGYADGLIRHMSGRAQLHAGDVPCPLLGRVSMDLLTVDVTHLDDVPETLTILGPHQGVDALADAAGTIGYEILTGLGARYERRYLGGAA